ncbi:hypothetical protein A8B79_10345 [Balneola sp. EhC07]|uniref:glycosyltransferase n=1 Tax=Balneola sp. EhC07 TaxID=1849360 RepID=UPI0007F34133|nr:glycosyltransferase [Balneola sp. EhC07]OAN60338.1 hypothetical protein A8B79_10345 [Balneola sp. EhC07]
MLKTKMVWVTGDGLRFPYGNASTNRLAEIAKGFQSNGLKAKFIPFSRPATLTRGNYNTIKFEYYFDNGKSKYSNKFLTFLNFRSRVATLSEACKKDNVSLIFCGTSSISSLMILWSVGRKCGIPIVYDIVEDPISSWLAKDLKHFSFKDWVRHILNLLKLPLIYLLGWKLPNYICAITNELKHRIISTGVDSKIIYTFPIVKFISEAESESITQKPIQDKRATLIHSGSTYFPKDGIGTIMESVRFLVEKDISINLEFYGPIQELESSRINEFAKKHRLEENIKVKGLVELPELFEAQRNAMALICFKPSIKQNRFNFATKIIDYLNSGRPVILSDLPVYDSFFEDGKNALICNEFNVEALAEKIEYLYKQPEKANQIGIEGKKILKSEFNSSGLTASLLTFIDQN